MTDRLTKIIQDNHKVRAALIQQDRLNVFFVEKEQLDNKKINFDALREELKDKLLLMNCEFLQVIGDSNPFSKTGHQDAVKLLQMLMEAGQSILLYGFTSNEHGGANGVV